MRKVSDGSTADYYVLPENAKELQDLISHRNMNAQIGEIFRACFRYGLAEHSTMLRDAKKIQFYANAEVARLEKVLAEDEGWDKDTLREEMARLKQWYPAVETGEEPPVPWDKVPDDFRWMTRDADGTIEAWMNERPSLADTGIWIGGVGGYRQRCLRLPDDDGQHEPKIWKRPEKTR